MPDNTRFWPLANPWGKVRQPPFYLVPTNTLRRGAYSLLVVHCVSDMNVSCAGAPPSSLVRSLSDTTAIWHAFQLLGFMVGLHLFNVPLSQLTASLHFPLAVRASQSLAALA